MSHISLEHHSTLYDWLGGVVAAARSKHHCSQHKY